ncbi:MAG: ChaN family lipoprotein [Syntrophobacteraceae bacterium]
MGIGTATIRFCLLLLIGLPLVGCTGLRVPFKPSAAEETRSMSIGNIVDTGNGNLISWDELAQKLKKASVVYVGETHTSMEDHNAQLAVLRMMYEETSCILVGMEMFPREAQPVLDRYARGEITEDEFLEEVSWDRIWGFPYQLYRGIMDFAIEKRLRIIGLNAPGSVVRTIARQGLASLTPGDRARVAEDFHLDDPKNRLRIEKEFNAHVKGHIKDAEAFFEAQLAWEETMAETIAEHLRESGRNCRILVIVGKGHISAQLGVPYLAKMRIPHEFITIAPVPIDYPHGTFDPNLAQYVLITDKVPSPHRPRLGVTIQTAEGGRGVEILDLFSGGPAAKAGISKGDIVTRVNGSAVKTAEELQQAIAEGGPEFRMEIERGGRKLSISVTISPE